MKIPNIAPLVIDWDKISYEKVEGSAGFSISKIQQIDGIKIRIVEYSSGFSSDHWCRKGHIIFVIEGELEIVHKDESVYIVKKGMSYVVGDNAVEHCAEAKKSCRVLIID